MFFLIFINQLLPEFIGESFDSIERSRDVFHRYGRSWWPIKVKSPPRGMRGRIRSSLGNDGRDVSSHLVALVINSLFREIGEALQCFTSTPEHLSLHIDILPFCQLSNAIQNERTHFPGGGLLLVPFYILPNTTFLSGAF